MIKWIWQLPQHLVGAILTLISKRAEGYYVYKHNSVCYGQYIFINERNVNETTIKHETGHSKQSLMFGPLYLIVIGLPSLLNWLVCRKYPAQYYKFWTESWADKLGGVNRTT